MKNLCVIPARGGSTRIPGKNMKDFHGKPILQYSIETAKRSGMFDEVIVSTDSMPALQLAQALGVTGEYRNPAMCQNDVGTQTVAAYVAHSRQADLCCVIYATAPLMSVADLRRGWQLLQDFPCLEFSYSVGEVDEKRIDAGQFYWNRMASLLAGKQLDTAPTGYIHIHPSRVCDINTPEDWSRAECMYLKLKKEKV